MKRKFTYPLLIIIFLGLTAFVVVRYNSAPKGIKDVYPLKERKGQTALLPEWQGIKARSNDLVWIVREDPKDIKSRIALASLYIQEARTTGDYTYYNEAALKYIDEVLLMNPTQFDALVLKSVVELSKHHFSEALETAYTARKINPYNAFIHGILVDGNVEMGNYKEAVLNSDQMMGIRPDIRSYSRVSYLREIHGDYNGAIEAMKLAVEAGGHGEESRAWSRVQLGKLYELTGDTLAAKMHYTIALEERPGYAPALAGLGHIQIGSKNYKAAINYYLQAENNMTDYSYREQLSQLYQLTGEKQKAEELRSAIIKELTSPETQEEESNSHHSDMELSVIYIKNNNAEKALQHALAEYNRRPENIDVNQALAWAYFHNSNLDKAVYHIGKALSTGSKNPELLCQAGLINHKKGDVGKARQFLEEGLKNNPNIDPQLKQQAQATLQIL